MAKRKVVKVVAGNAGERVRKLCLSLPGTVETSSWGHPNFRVAKRAYVTLEEYQQRFCVAIRLVDEQVRQLCTDGVGFATPYGRGQWISIPLDGRPAWRLIETLIRQSHGLATS